jgi:hypothetical protein
VDTNGRKVALHQQLIQLRSTAHALHKDHNLIEVECIQQVIELPIFLHLAQLDVVLFVMQIHQNYQPVNNSKQILTMTSTTHANLHKGKQIQFVD